MGKHLSIMIVVNIYASWLRQATNSGNRAESKVKVTKKVIKCKKIKCHIFDPMSDDKKPHEAMTSCCEDICQKPFHKNSERSVGCS